MKQSILLCNPDDTYEGIPRTDKVTYPVFEHQADAMQKRFWIPKTISLLNDKINFDAKLSEAQRKVFTVNLFGQILADSDQYNNIINILPFVNNIELKTCFVFQLSEEKNHDRSYQYTVSSMYDNPSAMLDESAKNKAIQARRNDSSVFVNNEGEDGIGILMRMFALESITFTNMFLVTTIIHDETSNAIAGNMTQIQKIASDESGHVSFLSNAIKIIINQESSDSEGGDDVREFIRKGLSRLFDTYIGIEVKFNRYLQTIHSMPQISPELVKEFLEYKANTLVRGVGVDDIYPDVKSSILLNWYNSRININKSKVEPQAGHQAAYMSDVLSEEWKSV